MRAVLAVLAAALAVAGCGEDEPGAVAPAEVARDPAPAPTVVPAEPTATPAPPAPRPRGWLVAEVTRPTRLRSAPGGRVLARLAPTTEFGSIRTHHVVRRRGGWLEVLAAELANGETGWIRADRARLARVTWSVHVDRSRREVTVRRDGRRVRRFSVAVGRPGTPTPLGRYAVTDKLRVRGASPYGCCIVALTGHQTRLVEGWPGGDRLALHGTTSPESIGQRASLGCLRAPADELRRMLDTLPLGAPVFIRR